MKKSIISMMLCSLIMTITIITSHHVYAFEFDITDDILQTDEFVKESNKYYEEKYGKNYIKFFKANEVAGTNASKIRSLFDTNSEGEIIYPDYIGGIYIDDNNNLVLQVVDTNLSKLKSEDIKMYSKILDIDKNLSVQYVKHSYSELQNTFNKIQEYLIADKEISDVVSIIYIDVINNSVVVGLKDYNDDNIKKLKEKIIDSDAVTFIKYGNIMTSQNINAGGNLSSLGCSAGYRAKQRNQVSGFVTAGHCVIKNQVTAYGKVVEQQFGGSIDAAWIQASSNVTPTNVFQQYATGATVPSSGLSVNEATPTVGQLIGRVGAATGLQTGKVTATPATFFYSDEQSHQSIQFTNQVLTDVYQSEGDSGGIVYLISNRYTMGIGTFRNSSYNMIFSRADKIDYAFNLVRY